MKHNRLLAIILALALLLPSCVRIDPIDQPPPKESQSDSTDTKETAKETEEITETETEGTQMNTVRLAAASKAPEKVEMKDEFKSALIDFSDKLYKTTVRDEKKNVILSPLSVMYAYSLIGNAASGETLGELEELFSGLPVDALNNYLYTYTKELESTEKSTVHTANSAWSNSDNFKLSEDFRKIAEKYYDAEARSESFADPETVDKINKWANDNTDGLIPKVFDKLDPSWVFILMNSVLFDGVWKDKYEEYEISEGIFTDADGNEQRREFMYSEEHTYFEIDGGKGFSKAYEDGYKFVAVLPDGDVNEFVENMKLSEVLTAASKGGATAEVSIPKFEYEYQHELIGPLKSLGLKRIFSDSAELYGLSDSGKAYMIDTSFQMAKVITNEHGTKAAAVTVIAKVECAVEMPNMVYLNKPFFYAIVDKNDMPIFMGTVHTIPEA